MSKQYLDRDPITGISHWVSTDEETGITSYGADQNMDAILDLNQAEYNADHGRFGEWTKVASIPMVAFAQIVATGAIGEDGEVRDDVELRKALRKVLNDSDWRKLRTRPGTI